MPTESQLPVKTSDPPLIRLSIQSLIPYHLLSTPHPQSTASTHIPLHPWAWGTAAQRCVFELQISMIGRHTSSAKPDASNDLLEEAACWGIVFKKAGEIEVTTGSVAQLKAQTGETKPKIQFGSGSVLSQVRFGAVGKVTQCNLGSVAKFWSKTKPTIAHPTK